MKNIAMVIAIVAILAIPSVSFAAQLNNEQITSILSLLQAFNVDSTTLLEVQNELMGTTTVDYGATVDSTGNTEQLAPITDYTLPSDVYTISSSTEQDDGYDNSIGASTPIYVAPASGYTSTQTVSSTPQPQTYACTSNLSVATSTLITEIPNDDSNVSFKLNYSSTCPIDPTTPWTVTVTSPQYTLNANGTVGSYTTKYTSVAYGNNVYGTLTQCGTTIVNGQSQEDMTDCYDWQLTGNSDLIDSYSQGKANTYNVFVNVGGADQNILGNF